MHVLYVLSLLIQRIGNKVRISFTHCVKLLPAINRTLTRLFIIAYTKIWTKRLLIHPASRASFKKWKRKGLCSQGVINLASSLPFFVFDTILIGGTFLPDKYGLDDCLTAFKFVWKWDIDFCFNNTVHFSRSINKKNLGKLLPWQYSLDDDDDNDDDHNGYDVIF